jgi:DNA-binding GntR family transcriptional regulator
MVNGMEPKREDRQGAVDLVDQVYAQMLTLVRERGLPAPETLNVASLANDLGVSRTPVNMALVRLECEGLVHKLPEGGWMTAEYTHKDLEDLFELREVLDTLVVQKAVQQATPEDIAALFRIVDQMQDAAEEKNVDRWLTFDQRYKSYLLELTGNDRLKQIQEQLHNQLFRMMVTNLLVGDRMPLSTREHREMTEAIATGDPDIAVKHTLNHLFSMKASLLDMYNNILLPLRGQRPWGSGRVKPSPEGATHAG